jgi:transcriptional regulator with XRE-family HTH domain
MKALNRQIGQRLRNARIMRGLSQAQLAKVIGVNGQQIQNYETGTSAIPATRMKYLADRLGMPINYFFRLPEYEMPELNIPTQQMLRLLRALQQLEQRHPTQLIPLYRYIVSLAEATHE